MIACLSDPLNGKAWSSYHCQDKIRHKCIFKHIVATVIRLTGDTIGCVNRPPGQQTPKYIHAFIMCLERETLASRQQLQVLIRPWKSFMRFRPGALGESIGLNKLLYKEPRGDPSGLIHSKQLQKESSLSQACLVDDPIGKEASWETIKYKEIK